MLRRDHRLRRRADTFTGVFSYGDMPFNDAEKSMRPFAREVMPALKNYQRQRVAAEQAAMKRR